MKYLRFVAFFAPLAILLTSCSGTKWLTGNWQGTGEQIDGQSWAIDLTYSQSDSVSINYPDLSCGGIWTILEENKKEIVFKEKIEYGVSLCDQGNEVFVTKIDKNTIKVVYYLRSYDPVDPIAEAILYKTIEG